MKRPTVIVACLEINLALLMDDFIIFMKIFLKIAHFITVTNIKTIYHQQILHTKNEIKTVFKSLAVEYVVVLTLMKVVILFCHKSYKYLLCNHTKNF